MQFSGVKSLFRSLHNIDPLSFFIFSPWIDLENAKCLVKTFWDPSFLSVLTYFHLGLTQNFHFLQNGERWCSERTISNPKASIVFVKMDGKKPTGSPIDPHGISWYGDLTMLNHQPGPRPMNHSLKILTIEEGVFWKLVEVSLLVCLCTPPTTGFPYIQGTSFRRYLLNRRCFLQLYSFGGCWWRILPKWVSPQKSANPNFWPL